jgi:hypothetical protein
MVVGKGEEGNNMALHMSKDIGVYYTKVVGGCMGCGVSWSQSTHSQHDTCQVCSGQMVRVSVHQVILCIGNPNEHK